MLRLKLEEDLKNENKELNLKVKRGYLLNHYNNRLGFVEIKKHEWVDILETNQNRNKIKVKYNQKDYLIINDSIERILPEPNSFFKEDIEKEILENNRKKKKIKNINFKNLKNLKKTLQSYSNNTIKNNKNNNNNNSSNNTDNLNNNGIKKTLKLQIKQINLLKELLFMGKPPLFTSYLCQIVNTSDRDLLARSLIHIFESKKLNPVLLEEIIKIEVNETVVETTLFRGNCIASKMLSAYARSTGNHFLKISLQSVIKEIINSGESLEIYENKIKENESIEQNRDKLIHFVQKLIKEILNAKLSCPLVIRDLCWKLASTTSKRFPKSKYITLAGFIFLRFLCPAIVVPESYGIIDTAPNNTSRRALVLVSKVIQSIANGTKLKERNIPELNSIILQNIPEIKTYMDCLVEPCFLCKTLKGKQDVLLIGKNPETNNFIACQGNKLTKDLIEISIDHLDIDTRSFNYHSIGFSVNDEQLILHLEKVYKLLLIPQYQKKINDQLKDNKQILEIFDQIINFNK
ncbi:ras gtpase-activating protein [Anaeramoeba flamelloides]|uniref:Ras gtpase-activating protein n=1 Tax=Anaeramoeba flamelloides TaxID=1746091 RepID=A0ABQ8YXH1_9EUKA|nr:ras gtpase-activating protein [Anaeramoeba flamelloides]